MSAYENQPVYHGALVKLRALTWSDETRITEAMSDERVSRNLALVPFPYPAGAAKCYLETRLRDEDYPTWAMDRDGDMVGQISLKPLDGGLGILGYWVHPEFWGRGYASDAIALVVKHARNGGFKLLEAKVHQDNPVSEHLLIAAGFELLGTAMENSLFHGKPVPIRGYGLTL